MSRLADCRLVVFDLDGVLVRTSEAHSLAYAELWQMLGLAAPAYSSVAGQTTRETVEAMTASLGPSSGEIASWVAFKQERARHYLRTWQIGFEDTVPVLEALRERGLTLALGTAASRAGTDLILDRLGIGPFFSSVMTGEDVEQGKPSPEVYTAILDQCGRLPEETLVVEDSAAGIQAALRSGAWVVSVRSGLRSEHPRFVDALDDLRALLTL